MSQTMKQQMMNQMTKPDDRPDEIVVDEPDRASDKERDDTGE